MGASTDDQSLLQARREEAWGAVRDALGAHDLRVVGGPASGGWSADTAIFETDGRRLVARFNPASEGLFPAAELATQAACMRAARGAGLPVPEVVLCDGTGEHIGEPVLVSAFVHGDAPRDYSPTFTESGPLHDASFEQQRHYSEHLVELLARLHHVPPPSELPRVQGLEHHLDRLSALREWRGGHELLADADAQLRGTLPDRPAAALDDDVLLWGDARPANTIHGPDFSVVAMLDWELAGRGPAEMDVAWLCEMNAFRGAGQGLPGFLGAEESWGRWSERADTLPSDRDWHERFAAFKLASILDLSFRAEVARGTMSDDHRLLRDNRGLRRLRELLAA